MVLSSRPSDHGKAANVRVRFKESVWPGQQKHTRGNIRQEFRGVSSVYTVHTHRTGKMQAREDLVQQARSHGREVNTDSRHGITDEFLTDTPFNQLVGVKVRHIRSMR